jgi:hypothetical protein
MARLVDRVGDEAARIGVVLDDLVADLSRAANGDGTPHGNGTLTANLTPNGNGSPHGNGTSHASVATGNGAMHNHVGKDRNETAGWRRPG